MAVFTTACFFPPLLLLLSFPTECICSNTINVTFTDCLLAFYLNGIQLWLAAAAAAAALTNLCLGVVPFYKIIPLASFFMAPEQKYMNSRSNQDPRSKNLKSETVSDYQGPVSLAFCCTA